MENGSAGAGDLVSVAGGASFLGGASDGEREQLDEINTLPAIAVTASVKYIILA